jgi:hypothetical protein
MPYFTAYYSLPIHHLSGYTTLAVTFEPLPLVLVALSASQKKNKRPDPLCVNTERGDFHCIPSTPR